MLYDPKWGARIEVPSLGGLIGWLETRDPNVKYDFDNCNGHCLVGQYMAYLGIPWTSNYLKSCKAIFGGDGYDVGVADEEPWTYGAALARARELTASAEHAGES